MSNRSMIIIYIKISSTIKKINLRFSYTFITFGIKIHVVDITDDTSLTLVSISDADINYIDNNSGT